ncbi:MAG TPA: site-specific integrase, partial [Coriobacteriia bacterium]|nr:site-specific integrase [Coriobacteriia bacterium]
MQRGSTWSFVIRVVDPETGRSRPRWVGGFATERDAKTARDDARVKARRRQYVDRSRLTVAAYLSQWLDDHEVEVKPQTMASYRDVVARYVVPRLGHVRLQGLRPAALTKLYRDLRETGGVRGTGLSPRTVDYVHAVLRKAFNDAVRVDQILASNPAERAKRPRRVAAAAREVWTREQLLAFLKSAESHRLYPFFHLAAYSGARRGELLNLRWTDVDLDGST